MTKIYTPDSSPEELEEFKEIIKSTAAFLNSNEAAKSILQDPKSRDLSEEELMLRLLSVMDEDESEK